ncbi:hypothetical protein ACFFNX_41285, partial [Actinoallomurus acaciae]
MVVPAAALLFGTLWVTGFYGSEVIPNFWVAVAGAAMTGWFVRAARSGGTAAYAGLATAGAVAALMRPGDAVWIWVPLPVAALLVHGWRPPRSPPRHGGGPDARDRALDHRGVP